jgi:hypothetical protein
MTNVVFIHLNETPQSFKNTKMFKIIMNNCKHNNNPIIPFPQDIYKKEVAIPLLLDLIYIIEKVYMLNKIIHPINYEFAMNYRKIMLSNIDYFANVYPKSIFVREIKTLLTSKSLNELYENIVDNNYLNLLNYVIYKKNNIIFIN